MKNIATLLLLSFLFITYSCVEDDVDINYYTEEELSILTTDLDLPEKPYDYTINLPKHLQAFNGKNSFEGDPNSLERINDSHVITLGRVLFYDKSLSKNNTVSCASCHDQKFGFSDNKRFSEGFNGEVTSRNSLALGVTPSFESAYGSDDFFGGQTAGFAWDEANENIQDQSKAAFLSKIEMGMTMYEVVERVREKAYYEVLFDKSFSDGIHEHNILFALERFVNSISSTETKFDKGLTKQENVFNDFSNFTRSENNGKLLFSAKCSSCHDTRQSTVIITTANNGLDIESAFDKGLATHTNQSRDEGVFKVPFLRNIELTGPYMHDGRFTTLEQVVDHYSSGINNHKNLSEILKDYRGKAVKMNFSDIQKQDLVAFLKTLTDDGLNANPKFSNPFKN